MTDKNEVQLRVAIYLRVSTEEQAQKYGLEAQRATIEGVLKSKGILEDGRDAMVLAGEKYVYIDDGVSGTVDINERFAFARLIEDITNVSDGQKPFDIVAVYKIDRFARRLKILLNVIELFKDSNIELVSATESIDTSTPFGRAMLNIMGTIAELELETIHERTSKGREQANLKGKHMGKAPQYGYTKDDNGFLIKLDEEAETVKRIFNLFLYNKLTPQIIADILTKDEILSPEASAVKNLKYKGKGLSKKTSLPIFWRSERIRSILSDEVYVGRRYFDKYKDRIRLPKSEWRMSIKQHEPIIYEPIFEMAQKRLNDLSSKRLLTKRKEQNHLYLLSGLLKCDHCKSLSDPEEHKMMAWTGGRKEINKGKNHYSYYYFCGRKNSAKNPIICPVVPIPAEPLEKYITNFITEIIGNPKRVYDYQESLKSSSLEKENIKQMRGTRNRYLKLLNSLPNMRKNILYQHTHRIIDGPTLILRLDELEKSKERYEKEMEEIDFKLSESFISKGYEISLNSYSERYGKALDEILNNDKEFYNLVHSLIYQIVVYSRPTNKRDKIAGRKKEGQMIPNKIDIHLNLPQNLLQELYTQRFGVKNDFRCHCTIWLELILQQIFNSCFAEQQGRGQRGRNCCGARVCSLSHSVASLNSIWSDSPLTPLRGVR